MNGKWSAGPKDGMQIGSMVSLSGIIFIIFFPYLVKLLSGVTVKSDLGWEQKDILKSQLPKLRSDEYCNKPEFGKNIKGLEGLHPDSEMKLLGAILLVRHGDRMPVSRPPVASNLSALKNCRLNHTAHPSTPLLHTYINLVNKYEDFIKDSVNPSLKDFALLPNTCSAVAITQAGIVQMLELGEYLGRRYFTHNPDQEVVFSTSRFARTYQSLLSFLYGFAKDKFLEVVNTGLDSSSSIYFCDGDKSDSPSYLSNCTCPNIINIPNLRRSLRYWSLQNPAIFHLYHMLNLEKLRCSNLVESLCTDSPVMSPSRVWDWLMSDYYCPGLELPCFSSKNNIEKGNCLNSSLISDLIHLVDDNQKQMINNSEYVKGASLVVYPLLQSISQKFQELKASYKKVTALQQDYKSPYLWVLSSHDVTIGPLFTALGKMSMRKVPYATRFVMELWAGDPSLTPENDEGKQVDYQIRFLLNGEDITHQIPFCNDFNASQSTSCSLDSFTYFLNEKFLKKFGFGTFQSACESYQR